MPQSTLYWIIAAIIVVLLILIILSVIASRRRREAEAEAAETRLERRGVTADTAGEQAAAPAAPTRLSRLDEVAAEEDARPAAAVKPAGGLAAFDTAAADRETDESVAGVAGGAGVTVDQQDAPRTDATAETSRPTAAPTTRGTLRPAAAAPSTAREADTVGLGAAGVAGGSGVTLDEQTPAADVPATPASPSPVTETPAPAAPAAEAPQHRSHLTPAPEHVHGTVPAAEVATEHTPTKEFATDAIPVPQGEHLETHTVATTAHGSVTVVATESDQAQQNGADGAERSAAGSLRIDGTPGVPGRVAEADREPARTDDHGADVAQPAAVEPAAERPSLEAAAERPSLEATPATRRAEAPETHAGTTPATPLGGAPELDPTAASSGRAEDATPATRREARAAQSAAAAGTAAPTSSTPTTVAPDTSTSSAPTDEEPAEDDTEGAALPDLRADRDETRGSDAEGESKLAQAGAVAASAFETVRDKVAVPLRDNVAVPAKDTVVKVVKDKLSQAQERRWGKR